VKKKERKTNCKVAIEKVLKRKKVSK